MPTPTKTAGKHFSKKTLLIAGGVATLLVVAWVLWSRKKSATQPQAAYSTDVGGLPGQNYLPATGIGGASTLGDGISAPPPKCPNGQPPNPDGTCPPPVTPGPCPTGQQMQNGVCVCPDGSTPNPDGSCGTTPPPQSATYKHGCFDGAGPGCGGPNRHCEYWPVFDGSGQPNPPSDCVQKGGNGGGQAPSQQPGTPPGPVTSDVLSSIGNNTTPNSPTQTTAEGPPGFPKAAVPTGTADAAVRMLHITQVVGRGNPSNPYEATSPQIQIGPAPPPTFPSPPPTNPGPITFGGH